jgi:hypothetical protein
VILPWVSYEIRIPGMVNIPVVVKEVAALFFGFNDLSELIDV